MSLKKSTILFAFSLAVAMSLQAADDIMKWNKTPEAYYMTTEERAQWAKVASPEDARKFVDEYFRKRGEQFGKDIRTRIDLADKQFRLDKTPGSRTARGRVWMILGSPNRSTTKREMLEQAVQAVPGAPITNNIEMQGLVETIWVYEADHLVQDLGRKTLTVNFQTDSSRGYEAIVNQGNIEPYLTKAGEYLSNQYIAATQAQTAQRSAAPAAAPLVAPTEPDPLWNATASLNGAIFTGESYLTAHEEPFYAYSFFVPSNAPAFADWKSALVVSLVRDASGAQVVANRQQVDLSSYDTAGNRYVDQSVPLAPGKYEGLFAIYSPDGGTLLASQRTTFEVPAKEAPRATGLFFTSKIDTLEQQQALDPFTFVAMKYAIRGDRQFKVSDKLAFFTVLANPNGATPNLMQKMIFTRDGKDFARTPLEPAQVTQTGPHTFLVGNAFDPETFPAGHYKIELQVRDMNAPEGSDLRTKGYVLTNEFDVVK